MKRIILTIALSLFMAKSFASNSGLTKINTIVILGNGFQIETVSNTNTCFTGGDRWFISNGHASADKFYAAMLAAMHNNTSVKIVGTGVCNYSREEVSHIYSY